MKIMEQSRINYISVYMYFPSEYYLSVKTKLCHWVYGCYIHVTLPLSIRGVCILDEPAKCECLTVAAALDGALEDSVGFVDDLSTLLDPDNPRNWQSLAQSYLNLSYNKIREIRYGHARTVLPQLSKTTHTHSVR